MNMKRYCQTSFNGHYLELLIISLQLLIFFLFLTHLFQAFLVSKTYKFMHVKKHKLYMSVEA